MGWLNLYSRITAVQALERTEPHDEPYLAKHRSTASITSSEISISIPDRLSFDKIIEDATCPVSCSNSSGGILKRLRS